MQKRHLILGGVFLLALVGVWLLFTLFGTHTVVLTEERLQHYVDAQMDKEIDVKGLKGFVVKSVTLNSADVNLADDKVQVNVALEGKLAFDKPFSFTMSTVGQPLYTDGAFYFKATEVTVNTYTGPGSASADSLKNLVNKYVTDEGLNNLAFDLGQKGLEWVGDLAEKTAVHVLETHPVYVLKDDIKGFVISAALESVKIDDDKLAVTFSLKQLTISAAFGLLILLGSLAFMIAILRSPALFTGFLVLSMFS